MRAYGTNPQVWDGDPNCEHVWGDSIIRYLDKRSPEDKARASLLNNSKDLSQSKQFIATSGKASQGNFCSLCGAWRGELGLEPTFELYIKHLMQIFTEVKRVLKKTGTCWVNLGDSYANSAGRNNRTSRTGFCEGVERIDIKHEIDVLDKSLCCIPDRFKIAMLDDESMDEYELRNDLTKEEKEYVLTELTKRGII